MPPRSRRVVPLVPRYRVAGLPLGGRPSLRRGHGSDVAGSRAYVRGDPVSTIDWRASARLSTARDRDEFVVRERYAEEAPRVVLVRDRRPSMSLYPPQSPWLEKPVAVGAAIAVLAASAEAVNSSIAHLDHGDDGEPRWLAPAGRGALERIDALGSAQGSAPEDGVLRSLAFLGRFRSELASGTFVFVISDFLGEPVPDSAWLTLAARRWEAVPVVVQDPVWEQSFPPIASVVLPLAAPGGGEELDVWLTRRQAARRTELNRRRRDELLAGFWHLGLEPVLLDTSDEDEVERRFLDWAERRRTLWRRR
ncbi:MAG TPA: DUF58 domain-containing protein [Gaiellaceae bacterium]